LQAFCSGCKYASTSISTSRRETEDKIMRRSKVWSYEEKIICDQWEGLSDNTEFVIKAVMTALL
jgi:CxxC motif-containing protein (DUF1111 family)